MLLWILNRAAWVARFRVQTGSWRKGLHTSKIDWSHIIGKPDVEMQMRPSTIACAAYPPDTTAFSDSPWVKHLNRSPVETLKMAVICLMVTSNSLNQVPIPIIVPSYKRNVARLRPDN